MYGRPYDSNFKKFCLYLTIKCKTPERKKFRVWAEETGKKNSKYADREIWVEKGTRTIYFSFPVSPKQLFIGCLNANNPNDESFEVVLMEAPLKTYNIDVNELTEKFLNMSIKFSQVCGYESANPMGRIFRNDSGEFELKYFPIITNRLTNEAMNTPARIGHESGIIEVAKCKMDKYTIPMREIILLHEFNHKWGNPKIGLPISSESGADILALYTYLGRGYPAVDALLVFTKVFYKSASPSNLKRLQIIHNYIKQFQDGEFAELN